MANTYLTPLIVTREAARRTLNHLVFAAYTDRSWSKQWKGKWDAKIGSSAAIRIPTKYIGGSGPALEIEDSVETSVPLTIGFYRKVHLNFDSSAFSLDSTISPNAISLRLAPPWPTCSTATWRPCGRPSSTLSVPLAPPLLRPTLTGRQHIAGQ